MCEMQHWHGTHGERGRGTQVAEQRLTEAQQGGCLSTSWICRVTARLPLMLHFACPAHLLCPRSTHRLAALSSQDAEYECGVDEVRAGG